ncbi:TAP-like protein-domain-containing protein [Dactylonectria macrodidyma]|uniref:TAP-like protein-domain-containing protein n=1 Tax=Dactylonectria macrodidyma TaxID=307937 RepID=A0A9P9FG53_9HYPO|nr:TAP-like protein-domain-containing protein [Dactylonectria macrodidyma]
MAIFSSLRLSQLLSVAIATPLGAAMCVPRSNTSHGITWKSCDLGLNETAPISCGSLVVPLDYTNETSDETLTLELLKVDAVNGPSKGSIMFNFGGPGTSGKGDFAYYAKLLLGATGGYHDLVTFVPRGTGDTLPFSCYATAEERALAALVNPFLSGNSSDVALGKISAEAQIFSQTCYHAQNKTGQLIGTAFVARDMMQIVDALEEDGMLRYWGVSYGTVLGATAAALFPERMDKVILDGVVNIFEYYSNTEVELYTDTDKAFSSFCEACIANPDQCVLATGNITASELEASVYAFFDDLKYNPIVIPDPTGGYVLEYSSVKPIIHRQLYLPQIWSYTATILNALLTRDLEALATIVADMTASGAALDAEAQFGIKCGDAWVDADADVLSTIEARHEASRIAGDTADGVVMRCAKWKLPAKERYAGDFDVETKNPMLIIGNAYDPVTPLASARNVSETFKGSVLLQQDSYGHDSLTQASLCTAKIVSAYFVDGKLPDKDTVCSVETPLFSGSDGWEDVLKQLAAEDE